MKIKYKNEFNFSILLCICFSFLSILSEGFPLLSCHHITSILTFWLSIGQKLKRTIKINYLLPYFHTFSQIQNVLWFTKTKVKNVSRWSLTAVPNWKNTRFRILKSTTITQKENSGENSCAFHYKITESIILSDCLRNSLEKIVWSTRIFQMCQLIFTLFK